MKTKIFTLVSAFSFAISSAECSEKMINDGGVQDDHATIEYGYNDTGVEIVCEENLCKTPVCKRRRVLPQTPDTPRKCNKEFENKAFNPTSFNEDLEEDIYKTPIMERRQGLSRISNALITSPIINMNEVSLRWLPMPPSFEDVEGSIIDSSKALDVRVLGPSDFITPVKERIMKVPSYQRPLVVSSANVTPVKQRNRLLDGQLSLPNDLMSKKGLKRAVSYSFSDEEKKSLYRVLFP